MTATFALATDDVMLFTLGDEDVATPWLKQLDDAIDQAGIQAHASKAVTAVYDETVIGIDVVGGRYLAPHVNKLANFMSGCLYFLKYFMASRFDIGAIMGHLSWFAHSRAMFGCVHEIYAHGCSFSCVTMPDETPLFSSDIGGRDVDLVTRRVIPTSAAAEILLFIGLSPLLEVDLSRDWQEHIVACDASDSFGFGVSVAQCPRDLTRQVGRAGKKRDLHVRTFRDGISPDEEPERPRKGEMLRLPLSKNSFSTVVSAKRRYHGHSGALEAHGVTLALRWVLRSASRHSRRTTLLIDARAVLGAVAKGRSSAATIKREVRRIGAYLLAGDLLLKPVYIPSEENPADAPSRGVVRRWRARGTPAPRAAATLSELRVPAKKRQLKQKREPFDPFAIYKVKLHNVLHEGPRQEVNFWRRCFGDDSDVSSCTSLPESSAHTEHS